MSNSRFATKRPGYLASSISFTEQTDVGLLTINLFKKEGRAACGARFACFSAANSLRKQDFGSQSQYEAGMAINCLSNICSEQARLREPSDSGKASEELGAGKRDGNHSLR